MRRHPDQATLNLLLDGRLTPGPQEALLSHLASCDSCLARAEALWGGVGAFADTVEVPALGRRSTERIELQLLRRVRTADLGSQIAWLATGGFVSVVVVLLRPLAAANRREE